MKKGISLKGLSVIKWAIWGHVDWMVCVGTEFCPRHRKEFHGWLNAYGRIEALMLYERLTFDHPQANAPKLKLVGGQAK